MNFTKQLRFDSQTIKKRVFILMAFSLILPFFNFNFPVEEAHAQTAPQCTQSIDTVIVMDVSNSMGECPGEPFLSGMGKDFCDQYFGGWVDTSLNNAKSLANDYLNIYNTIQPDDFVGLVSFSDYANPLVPIGPDKTAVGAAVSSLESGQGGTNIGAGLDLAINMLMVEGRPGVNKKILLLTDGDPTVGDPDPYVGVDVAYSLATSNGIGIYAVDMNGFGGFLFDMSNQYAQSYYDGTVVGTSEMEDIYTSNKYTDECGEPTGSLTICKQEDLNGDGVLDNGEPVVFGWTFNMNDTDYTDDNQDGCVTIDDLPYDTYNVTEEMQPGWQQTGASGNGTLELDGSITVDVGQSNPVPIIYFLNEQVSENGTLTVCKVEDLTGDGASQDDLPYLGGWDMSVVRDEIDFSEDFTTDGQTGCYTLAGLEYGSYYVTEDDVPGWTATDIVVVSNQQYDPVGNTQVYVDIFDDEEVIVYFYNYEPDLPSICGVKFFDHDQNGQQDRGDENLTDWTINLYPKWECSEGDEWADEVISYIPGPTVPVARSDSSKALGVAENNDTMNFVSLGNGGEIILRFDNFIENGSGDDLQVIETSYGNPSCNSYPEYVRVYASQNGVDWTDLGSACQEGDPTFDLGVLPWAQYIKLVDETGGSTADGFDLDGVRALNCLNQGELMRTTTTTDNGYCFDPLKYGHYMVCEELEGGWTNTTPLCQQIEITERNPHPTVDFGNYTEIDPGDSICGYKYEVDEEGTELGVLSEWPMSLWSATRLGSVDVYANDDDGVYPDQTFVSGTFYKIEVTGTAWAGDGIEFDAKYSERNQSGSWTDEVQNYESHGPELLDLQINGNSPDWGDYNSSHTYFVILEGDDSGWNFRINDIYFPNNEGYLTVTVYEVTDTGELTTTNDNGYYCFEGLDDGHYVVEEGMMRGYLPYGSTYCQVMDSDSFDGSCNFYNYEEPATTGTLTVCKYEDEDEDGDPQDEHPPLGEWTMTVMQDDATIDSGDTDSETGCIEFELDLGSYEVYEAMYEGWTQTYPVSDGGLDYHYVTLDAGEEELRVFFNRQYSENGGGCTENCGSPGGGGPTGGGGGPTSNPDDGTGTGQPTVKGFSGASPEIAKTVSSNQANPDQIITYNVSVTNSGDIDMTGVEVTDVLPLGFVFADSNDTFKTWTIGVLAANSTQNFTYDVKVLADAAAGDYINTATMISDEFDPLEAQATVTVAPVQVLGYESIPETGGGESARQILLYSSLVMMLVGAVLHQRRESYDA